MGQNRSSAVMQQRHVDFSGSEDFPTPPWATRALCEELVRRDMRLHLMHAWDPACNRGYMVRPLGEYFDKVFASDIHDYGFDRQFATADFLQGDLQPPDAVDMIITNPPFRLARVFVQRGLELAPMVAVLVRVAFDEGLARYEALFKDCPEWLALPFVERVVMWQGVLLDPDIPVWHANEDGSGVLKKPTTATAYQWLVFRRTWAGDSYKRRLAPCRKALTRPGDYPRVPKHLRGPLEASL